MENMNILLVSDTEKLILTAQRLFPKMGFEVLAACDSEEALQALDEKEIGAAFIDHDLLGTGAFSLLETVRLRCPVMEIVMLVGVEHMETAVQAMRSGASDYLVKPVSMRALLEKTEEAWRRNQIHKHRIDDALHMAPWSAKSDHEQN